MNLAGNAPGVYVNEQTYGPIPLEIVGSRSVYIVNPALRGPLTPRLITNQLGFHRLYGRRSTMTFGDDAIRAVLETVGQCPVWYCRVVGAGNALATVTLGNDGTAQVETATVIGTITLAGNAQVVVTAAGMTGSPISLNVAVALNDNASAVAGKIRTALLAETDITDRFNVTGTGPDIILTRKVSEANDGTLNVSIDNGTCTGLTAALTSANTTAGVAATDVLQVDSKGPGADYNYVTGPPKLGVGVTYSAGTLKVYDYTSGSTRPVEIFDGVTYDNYAAKVQEINSRSSLINVTWLETTLNPDTFSAVQGLTGGADGSAVTSVEIIGDEALTPKTGIYAFIESTFDPGYLIAPGYTDVTVGLALLDCATRSRKLAIIDSTFGLGANEQDLITEKQQYASDHGYAIYCAQWLKSPDIDTGAIKDVPRSPFRAAHIIFSQTFPGGIANVGAGTSCVYPNVVGLEYDFDTTAHDLLNQNGVDIPRNFARFNRGLVSFSGRTVSANLMYRFNSVRTIFNVLTVTLERGLLDEVFGVIDGQGKLSAKIVARIEEILVRLWRDGALFGHTARDAFKVIPYMDDLALIEQGILTFDVFAKPSPVAERLIINLYRTALTVDLKNNTVFAGDIAVAS